MLFKKNKKHFIVGNFKFLYSLTWKYLKLAFFTFHMSSFKNKYLIKAHHIDSSEDVKEQCILHLFCGTSHILTLHLAMCSHVAM